MIKTKLPLNYEYTLIVMLVSLIVILNITPLSEVAGVFGVLRLLTGLVGVLLLPGYLLQAALFPRIESLDALERIALSFVLSVIIIPPLTLLLDLTPGIGLTQTAIFVSECVMIAVLGIASWLRRRNVKEEYRMHWALQVNAGQWWQETSRIERIFYGLFAFILLVGGISAISIVTQSGSAELLTEFYIVTEAGSADGLPFRVYHAEPITLMLGIVNREGRDLIYRVEITHNDNLLAQHSELTLANGERTEFPATFTLTTLGEEQLVTIALYRAEDTSPYRSLRLYLDVIAKRTD